MINSIKQMSRAPLKSIALFFMIIISAVLLVVGSTMLINSNKQLNDIEKSCITLATVQQNEDAIEEEKRNEIINKLAEQELLTLNEEGNESWSIPLLAITNSGEATLKEIGTSINYNEGQAKNSPLTDEQKQELYDHYYELLKK